jgi:O-antigen/teichoic acid export membrane protein
MNTGRTALVHFLSQIGVSIAGFVATFFIARELGSEPLGLYTIGVGLLFAFGLPMNAIGSAITKRVSEGRDTQQFLWTGLVASVGVGLLLATFIFLGRGYFNRYIGAELATLLAALVVVQSLYTAVRSGLNGQKRVAFTGIVTVVERTTRTALQVGLILLGFHVSGLYVGFISSLVVATALAIIVLDLRPALPNLEHLRSLLNFTKFSWLGKIKSLSFGWMDTIVLAYFVTPSLVGIYEVAWTLSNVLALAGGSIQQTLFPELSELSARGEDERIRHFLNEAIVYSGLFTIPGLFGAYVLGERVLAIYRPEFTTGATVLVILIVAQLVSMYGGQFLTVLNAVDRPDIAFRVNAVFVVANLLLNIVFVATIGWVGAAIATTISAMLMLGLSYRYLTDIVGRPSLPLGELSKEVLASLVMFVAVLVLKTALPTGIPGTLLLVGCGATVYGLVLLSISSRVRDKVRYILPI